MDVVYKGEILKSSNIGIPPIEGHVNKDNINVKTAIILDEGIFYYVSQNNDGITTYLHEDEIWVSAPYLFSDKYVAIQTAKTALENKEFRAEVGRIS